MHEHAAAIRSLRLDSQLAADVRAALRDSGRHLVHGGNLLPRVARAADATARSVREQAEAIVGEDIDVDLAADGARYVEAVVDRMDEDVDDTIECSMSALDEWAADGELDEIDLELMLDECGERHLGKLLGWLVVMFGWTFGQMVRETHSAAGVDSAVWTVMQDDRVRPAHAALDGVEFQWDGPAPLSAAESTNHEPCFPGDDLGCRCLAAIPYP